MRNVALKYGLGLNGLQVDHTKCIELLRKAAGLGCSASQSQLGQFYEFGQMGLQRNEEEAHKCWQKAAECGDVQAQHNLGCAEDERGDHVAAMRHWRLSAAGGLRPPMINLIVYFQDGFLRHEFLAETLQAFYRSRAEMRSKGRDQNIAHLKRTGEYDVSMES